MPVLEYHLAEGSFTAAQGERLLVESSRFYAEVLKSPIERVRVFIHAHKPHAVAVGGIPVARGAPPAPY